MAVQRANDENRQPPTIGQRLITVALVVLVLVIAVIVTQSAQAVGVIAPPLLLLLAWLDGHGMRINGPGGD